MQRRKNLALYFVLIVIIVIIDQLTKYWCVNNIQYQSAGINVLPFFNIVHVYNYGAAFSFLADMGGWQTYFLSFIAIFLVILFSIFLYRGSNKRNLTNFALALFIAGALGNLIDRVSLGYVVDFLLFYIIYDDQIYSYPAFNVADISVCIGAFLLIISSLFDKKKDGI